MIIEQPGLGFIIERVWVFTFQADDGDESVPAVFANGMWYPLVAADPARLESMRPQAERLARESGKPIKLVCFEKRVDVETIKP